MSFSRLGRPAALIALATLLAAAPASAATLKIATLAPEGSSWMILFHKWARAVESRTDGRVKVKFYAGGIEGDEADVLRKIRLGQISGAALTGIGLSSICPEVRAFDIARSYEELDALRAAIGDEIKQKFLAKGFLVAAWGEVGPIHLFSSKPVKSMADLRGLRLWLWTEDPVSKALFATLGLHGVPMGVPDVLPGLSTGQIDSFFGSPLSTLALQWSSHVKYMTELVVGEATGATVLSKRVWDAIAPADQQVMKEEGDKMQKVVLAQVRSDNAKALEAMKSRGLTVVSTPPELGRELDRRGEAVARAAGSQLDKNFQAKVQKVVEDLRAKHAAK
ncbi:MAG TPA: TRAP transporter substrate-binding protein DctP [Polyangia bacterium]|jgi:TRAP-type C4-dicarboxylate transport system substrate-binding protein